eukprot:6386687-Ditylum_brightwellii.AAC.1
MMFSAAEALLFTEKLGLSFQDIHFKNIGISQDSDHAFLYDNTYLSLIDKSDQCALPSPHKGGSCRFCRRDLRLDYRRPHYTDYIVRHRDCIKFTQTIISLLPHQADFQETLALFKDLDLLLYSGRECRMTDVWKALKNTLNCIPSGDQTSINTALSNPLSKAVLCPGAIFELTGPVIFNGSNQSLYTEGKPTGPDRAVLRIADPTVTTAVVMVNCDGAELSHVIVDGNRPSLGKTVSELYDGALIQAGGGGQGQIIQHIDAYEPRGWAVLYVSEGDPVHRCSAALIENNKIGPAGEDMARASGMVMACPNSVVRGNNITNATNVGLSAFGALGSTVENNLIVGRESSCIASGDQEAINKALSIRLAVVELCPGAVFELSDPITFRYDYQSLYTCGKPTGPDRAVLRIVDPSVTTAVVMVNRDGAELSH